MNNIMKKEKYHFEHGRTYRITTRCIESGNICAQWMTDDLGEALERYHEYASAYADVASRHYSVTLTHITYATEMDLEFIIVGGEKL